jgi:hypothetical protein
MKRALYLCSHFLLDEPMEADEVVFRKANAFGREYRFCSLLHSLNSGQNPSHRHLSSAPLLDAPDSQACF